MILPEGAFPRRDGGHIFAVGHSAFANDPGGRKGIVVLTDASGKVAVGHLADGDEVEIIAWLPRRGATLYQVQVNEQRIDGWLRVTNLRMSRRPEAPAAPVPV